MDEVRGKNRRKRHHTETITRRELDDRIPELLDEAGLPPDEPVDVTHDERGNITIAPHESRFEKLSGIAPGFDKDVDLEASRDGWER